MKKHKLKIDLSSELDLFLIGISSTEPDYKLCWELNNALFIELAKTNDHSIKNKTGIELNFTRFHYVDENSLNTYTLIRNKENNNYLIEDLKAIDFIFIIKSEFSESEKKHFLTQLRNLTLITAAIEFSSNNVRYKERLLIN